jgi:hypothetical protein
MIGNLEQISGLILEAASPNISRHRVSHSQHEVGRNVCTLVSPRHLQRSGGSFPHVAKPNSIRVRHRGPAHPEPLGLGNAC